MGKKLLCQDLTSNPGVRGCHFSNLRTSSEELFLASLMGTELESKMLIDQASWEENMTIFCGNMKAK